MADRSRYWQAGIWFGQELDEMVLIFGNSLATLRAAARTWLLAEQPPAFSGTGLRHRRSLYLCGNEIAEAPGYPGQALDRGWQWIGKTEPHGMGRKRFPDFEHAVSVFLAQDLIPWPGPDYLTPRFDTDAPPLHLVKTIRRERDTDAVNDFLRRGWFAIGVEYIGRHDHHGQQLLDRRAQIVLGHFEDAAR
jgi:hypothetical protein